MCDTGEGEDVAEKQNTRAKAGTLRRLSNEAVADANVPGSRERAPRPPRTRHRAHGTRAAHGTRMARGRHTAAVAGAEARGARARGTAGTRPPESSEGKRERGGGSSGAVGPEGAAGRRRGRAGEGGRRAPPQPCPAGRGAGPRGLWGSGVGPVGGRAVVRLRVTAGVGLGLRAASDPKLPGASPTDFK